MKPPACLVRALPAVALCAAVFLAADRRLAAAVPYYFYSENGITYIVGSLQLWPSAGAAASSFAVDAAGNVIKAGAISAGGTIASPYGVSCSTLQLTGGAAEGYVATSDAHGMITLRAPADAFSSTNTWTGTNNYSQETHHYAPVFAQAGAFATSITRYGNGPFYIYTIGDDLISDATNFYLNTNKMKLSCTDAYGMYIGSGTENNPNPASLQLDMNTLICGSCTVWGAFAAPAGMLTIGTSSAAPAGNVNFNIYGSTVTSINFANKYNGTVWTGSIKSKVNGNGLIFSDGTTVEGTTASTVYVGSWSSNYLTLGLGRIQGYYQGVVSSVTINALGGRVGIGTSSPSEILHVNGTIKANYGVACSTVEASGQVKSNGNKLIDTYDYAVPVSSPYALGTTALCISPFCGYAITITTISAHCTGGTSAVFSIEQRAAADPDATGTAIWTGNVTATASGWAGGTAADFTVPADCALYLVPVSVSGDVARLTIKYRITKD